ncbi:MAG: Zn-dependent hydrolase, partial [Bacteroidales bacterium]|nr:Zn-dependent hydrolase [Bacteroidales bacterium]
MIKKAFLTIGLFGLLFGMNSCNSGCEEESNETKTTEKTVAEQRLEIYTDFTLTSDISHLSANEKEMLKILFVAAEKMNSIYWQETWGNKTQLMEGIADPNDRQFAEINYGPWGRLNDNKPFIDGIGEKPAGVQFYPSDMTKEEFDAWDNDDKLSQYTMIIRNEDGSLAAVWYHDYFKEEIDEVASLLKEAAKLAADDGFKNYLNLRAEALLTDDYLESDMAWMDMRDNHVDIVIGPIENYEDALFGTKAAHEAFILIKDLEWTKKLAHFAQFLPELQTQMPVADEYKQEKPGGNADLGAYDAIYYAGDCNAGSKTIAINLPNDERVHLEKGSRRLQLKNSMRAKFDKILIPISEVIIAEDQRKHVTFDAFFANTMFHEVAHGLGIKNTINGKGDVRSAIKEQYSALEEGKADILGLFMVTKLHEKGELGDADLMDNYVTFMAGIFRSVRFGAASSHGKANMIRFNYFLERNAFSKAEDGTYS